MATTTAVSDDSVRDTVKKIFTEYLVKHEHRKTPERYAILDEIYTRSGHFDVEALYKFMKEKNYRVSRATLYNTIELLLDSKLLVKHQFGKNMAQFERTYGNAPHDHLICTNCGKIFDTTDSNIDSIVKEIAINAEFTASHHSLYIYGTCAECQGLHNENLFDYSITPNKS
ncbi:MAG: transcriptional repressor [Marinilabiliaceae bacterium]|nr:transcriptional repressor [Marinilabiliaceae bacterium]